MRYVIMANGQCRRWNNALGVKKHLIEIEGETLLARTVRLIHKYDQNCELIIASSYESHNVSGARRHSPRRNKYELDRFCYELVCDDVCFLYGDVYYTDETIESIVQYNVHPMVFFGNERTIVAVKVQDGSVFKSLVDELFGEIYAGRLCDARGWDLLGLARDRAIVENIDSLFVTIDSKTTDFNTIEDYRTFMNRYENQ